MEAKGPRRCLYEVLGIERSASETEIKKGYRKMALRWHPDKNIDNADEAEEKFKEIQAAYDILSDPQERSWYDSHRASFLAGKDAQGATEEGMMGKGYDAFEELDVDEYLSSSCFKGFGKGKRSFFTVYASLFDKIAEIERDEAENADNEERTRVLPSFGGPDMSPEDTKKFYDIWGNIVSQRSFSFCDKWRLSEAPSRKIRRLMDQDNRKQRARGRKEYHSSVRELVAFAKKKDPRYAQYLREKREAEQRRQENRNMEKMLEAKRRKDARKKNAVLEAQRLQDTLEERRRRYGDVEVQEAEEGKNKEEEVQVLACVICNKTFKSMKQYTNHARSKKHKALVNKIKAQKRREEQRRRYDPELNGRQREALLSRKKAFEIEQEALMLEKEEEEGEGEAGGDIAQNDDKAAGTMVDDAMLDELVKLDLDEEGRSGVVNGESVEEAAHATSYGEEKEEEGLLGGDNGVEASTAAPTTHDNDASAVGQEENIQGNEGRDGGESKTFDGGEGGGGGGDDGQDDVLMMMPEMDPQRFANLSKKQLKKLRKRQAKLRSRQKELMGGPKTRGSKRTTTTTTTTATTASSIPSSSQATHEASDKEEETKTKMTPKEEGISKDSKKQQNDDSGLTDEAKIAAELADLENELANATGATSATRLNDDAGVGGKTDVAAAEPLASKKHPVRKETKKQRRRRLKREAEAKEAAKSRMRCDKCKKVFSSRSKLFAHLKESGHASLKK